MRFLIDRLRGNEPAPSPDEDEHVPVGHEDDDPAVDANAETEAPGDGVQDPDATEGPDA